MANDPRTLQVRVAPAPGGPLPTAEAANWFAFSHVAGEIQLFVGYLDLNMMADVINRLKGGTSEEIPDVNPEITRRIMLSPRAFLLLRSQVEQIFQKLREADAIEDPDAEGPQESNAG